MITAGSPYNSPNAAVSPTLTGTSFAFADATVTANLALADCATASWTSATSATYIGIRGGGAAGAWLRVARAVGTSSAIFSFDGAHRLGHLPQ